MRHRLAGGGHDAVIGRHNEHGHVGRLRPAGTHRGERLVTGGIQERDLSALGFDLICADMLGNAACLAFSHVGGANGVEQLGLAVINVTHDGDDRRPADRVRIGLDLQRGATQSRRSPPNCFWIRLRTFPNSGCVATRVAVL